jgi:hypothetical protein
MPGSLVFPRGSHVLEYWLAHAEGFTVRSRGSVESVIVEPLYGRATALVVRSGPFRRRRVVSAAEVAAVDPEARVLELERNPAPKKAPREPRLAPRLRAVRSAFVASLRTALAAIGTTTVATWRAVVAATAWCAPRLARLARHAVAASLDVSRAAAEAGRSAFERAVRWYQHRGDGPYLYGRPETGGRMRDRVGVALGRRLRP